MKKGRYCCTLKNAGYKKWCNSRGMYVCVYHFLLKRKITGTPSNLIQWLCNHNHTFLDHLGRITIESLAATSLGGARASFLVFVYRSQEKLKLALVRGERKKTYFWSSTYQKLYWHLGYIYICSLPIYVVEPTAVN